VKKRGPDVINQKCARRKEEKREVFGAIKGGDGHTGEPKKSRRRA